MSIRIYLLVFILAVLAVFSSGHYGGDGLENYLTAESIVLDHDLAIHDRPFDVKEMRCETRGLASPAGKYYSTYGIGMPVLLIPFYVFGNVISRFIPQIPHDYITQFTVSLANPLIIALTSVTLFMFLGSLGYSMRVSFLTVLCYSFCTMSLIYARSGFSEPAVGLFVLLAFYFAYQYEKTGIYRYLIYASCLIGYTLLIKMNSFLYLPLLAAYLIYKSFKMRPARRLVGLWLAICVPVLFFSFFYFYVQNVWIRSGGIVDERAAGELLKKGSDMGLQVLKGLYYYLLSPGKGFFLYNIPLILALFAIRDFTKKRKDIAICILVFLSVNILYYSLKFIRGTLFSWGPRYLYPILPLLCIFMAEYIKNAKTLAKKATVIFFCLAGFLVQLPNLFVNLTGYLLFVKEKLGLQEYLINFIPELSPIKGTWWLFLSMIKRMLTAVSLDFAYNPDRVFVMPVKISLAGYDVPDIWWANVVKVFPSYAPVATAAIMVLTIVAIAGLIGIKRNISGRE